MLVVDAISNLAAAEPQVDKWGLDGDHADLKRLL